MSELEWMDIFSGNLKDIIDDAWMTRKEISQDTGITEAALSRYINRERMPDLMSVIKLTIELDAEVEELLDIFGEDIY